MDYTKGILERFLAVERLLELHPEWIGRFTFIQIAAPTRTGIEEYTAFERELRALTARINGRFSTGNYQPIILKAEHHEPPQVYEYFRSANVCFVSSLHDGMNLVAKEFLAARDDEQGVLVLSQFTGAARELSEALVVNPYDIDQCARRIAHGPDDGTGRAARAHADHAHRCPRLQHLPLGGPHAAGCGQHARARTFLCNRSTTQDSSDIVN